MRILYLTPYTPNRIRTRPYHLIRGLSAHGHDVTVLTVTETPAEETDARALETHCAGVITTPLPRWRAALNCLVALPTGAPLQSAYSWQPDLMQKLKHLTGTSSSDLPSFLAQPAANGHSELPAYDVIHIEHLRGARYGLALKAASNGTLPPIVWDSVDCISHLFGQAATHSRSSFGRIMTRLELSRTRQFEAKLPTIFDQTLVTSDADRRALLALTPSRQTTAPRIHVLPNGVDLDYFTPASAGELDDDGNFELPSDGDPAAKSRDTLIVSGKMSYHANVTMVMRLVHDIMPRVWAHRPHVQLLIVGKDPTTAIQEFSQHNNITVTSTVPDIRPYLRRATVSVAPLTYGAGIQNKVLEAMACGAPVIASPQAASALSAKSGRDLLVAGDDKAFADAILDLLAHRDQRRRLAVHGRAYVEVHHSWSKITARLVDIYASAATKPVEV